MPKALTDMQNNTRRHAKTRADMAKLASRRHARRHAKKARHAGTWCATMPKARADMPKCLPTCRGDNISGRFFLGAAFCHVGACDPTARMRMLRACARRLNACHVFCCRLSWTFRGQVEEFSILDEAFDSLIGVELLLQIASHASQFNRACVQFVLWRDPNRAAILCEMDTVQPRLPQHGTWHSLSFVDARRCCHKQAGL